MIFVRGKRFSVPRYQNSLDLKVLLYRFRRQMKSFLYIKVMEASPTLMSK